MKNSDRIRTIEGGWGVGRRALGVTPSQPTGLDFLTGKRQQQQPDASQYACLFSLSVRDLVSSIDPDMIRTLSATKRATRYYLNDPVSGLKWTRNNTQFYTNE